jgi:hypothetical protein
MVHRLAHCADAVALDQNLAGLEQASSVYLEQPGCVENDGRACRRLRGGCACHKGQRCANRKEAKAFNELWHG